MLSLIVTFCTCRTLNYGYNSIEISPEIYETLDIPNSTNDHVAIIIHNPLDFKEINGKTPETIYIDCKNIILKTLHANIELQYTILGYQYCNFAYFIVDEVKTRYDIMPENSYCMIIANTRKSNITLSIDSLDSDNIKIYNNNQVDDSYTTMSQNTQSFLNHNNLIVRIESKEGNLSDFTVYVTENGLENTISLLDDHDSYIKSITIRKVNGQPVELGNNNNGNQNTSSSDSDNTTTIIIAVTCAGGAIVLIIIIILIVCIMKAKKSDKTNSKPKPKPRNNTINNNIEEPRQTPKKDKEEEPKGTVIYAYGRKEEPYYNPYADDAIAV